MARSAFILILALGVVSIPGLRPPATPDFTAVPFPNVIEPDADLPPLIDGDIDVEAAAADPARRMSEGIIRPPTNPGPDRPDRPDDALNNLAFGDVSQERGPDSGSQPAPPPTRPGTTGFTGRSTSAPDTTGSDSTPSPVPPTVPQRQSGTATTTTVGGQVIKPRLSAGDNTTTTTSLNRTATSTSTSTAPTTTVPVTQPATTTTLPPTTTTEPLPTEFVFQGSGWGHGVGMSQYGARGRALANQTYGQILAAYYPGTQLGPSPSVTELAVLIDRHPEVVVTGQKMVISGLDSDIEVSGAIRVKRVGGSLELSIPGVECSGAEEESPAGDKALSSDSDAPTTTESPCTPCGLDACSAASFEISGSRLVLDPDQQSIGRGRLRLAADGDDIAVIIPELAIEDYLLDITEMPASWPSAALQAQAVAARTYAVRTVSARRAWSEWNHTYDLRNTVQDQVWNGASATSGSCGTCDQRWIDAVQATDGNIISYLGQPIEALYSSSNGGWSADSSKVFAASQPYLPSVADPYDAVPDASGQPTNPNAAWIRKFSASELVSILNTDAATAIGAVTNIETIGVGPSGRTDGAFIEITGDQGASVLVPALTFRAIVNAAVDTDRALLSSKYVVSAN